MMNGDSLVVGDVIRYSHQANKKYNSKVYLTYIKEQKNSALLYYIKLRGGQIK